MDGWMGGWVNGWMDGWVGRVDGWMVFDSLSNHGI
jgi:hypothetical protein